LRYYTGGSINTYKQSGKINWSHDLRILIVRSGCNLIIVCLAV